MSKTLKDCFLKSNYTLITGASSGIGYELAWIFARQGHSLVLVARSADKLKALKLEIEKHHKVHIEVTPIDLSVAHSAKVLFEQIQNKKISVDCLVNNAGFGDYGPFLFSKLDRLQNMIQLNITTLTDLTHLFLPGMIDKKFGHIMNVASTASFQPGPLMAVYYATKAYVLSFSEALYEELQGTGVTVTALCPGPTESGFQEAAQINNQIELLQRMKVPTSKEVAEYGYAAMNSGRAVAIQGLTNRIASTSVRFFPRSLVRKLVMRLQKSKNKT